ncbi:MAG: sigma-70 family RNA polymerase sigma factor [Bacillota bacterium]|nr:sigma-70 family RNA polymerase sigma factor [Bacillota bacterium]
MHKTKSEFENIYKEHYNKLFNVAYHITGNKEDAEDSLQEAYLNAYKAFSTFHEQSSISTWLYRITVNSSLKLIKKRKTLLITDFAAKDNVSELELLDKLKSAESVENTVIVNDIREMCLNMFLNCMPRKQRITFVLKVLLQMSVNEVSLIMNISKEAVKVNVYRAKQLMKENIGERCSLINPNNPCKCNLWIKYIYDNNLQSKLPVTGIIDVNHDYVSLVNSEIDFVSKLIRIYNTHPAHLSSTEFIDKMKEIILNKNLKIFS